MLSLVFVHSVETVSEPYLLSWVIYRCIGAYVLKTMSKQQHQIDSRSSTSGQSTLKTFTRKRTQFVLRRCADCIGSAGSSPAGTVKPTSRWPIKTKKRDTYSTPWAWTNTITQWPLVKESRADNKKQRKIAPTQPKQTTPSMCFPLPCGPKTNGHISQGARGTTHGIPRNRWAAARLRPQSLARCP